MKTIVIMMTVSVLIQQLFSIVVLFTTTLTVVTSAIEIHSSKDSKILVHIPFQIHNPDGFDHIAADFGFGSILNDFQSISQYVYYIEETLCYPVTNHSIGHPSIAEGHSWEAPFILLINGGGICSHVTKVRNAQAIGASAVLLAQPNCACYNTNCTTEFNDLKTCEQNETIVTSLINDGSAGDISIPSFYIMKQFSEKLKDNLRKNQPVLLELQWGLADTFMSDEDKSNDVRPEIHLYTSAYDPHVRLEVYNDIRTVTNAFSDTIQFVHHNIIFSGERYNCLGTPVDGTNYPCDHLCAVAGKYCHNHATDLSGFSIVKETVRRSCIWEHSLKDTSNTKHDMYWNYVVYHKKECGKYPSSFADDKCITEAMKIAKIDSKSIQLCMDNSGKLDSDDKNDSNTILESILQDIHSAGIVTIPSLTFNKHTLHRTSGYLLFEVICNEYWMSNVRAVPDICIKCSSCTNTIGCIENHGKCTDFNNNERYVMPNENTDPAKKKKDTNNNKKSSSFSSFFRTVLWILFFGGLFGGAYYYYETQLKHVRRSGTRPLMNDYLHLNVDG